MGGSTVEGLLSCSGLNASDICVAEPCQCVLDKLAKKGVSTTTDNAMAVIGADMVMVFVKPWLVEQVLKGIKDSMDYDKQALVVVAAGISSAQIEEWMKGEDGRLPDFFLCIPNIAIAQRQSMTFLVAAHASEEATERVKAVFDDLGETILTDEQHLAASFPLPDAVRL